MEKGNSIVLISALFLLLAISIVSASIETDFLNLINNERTSLGKTALTYNDNLNQAAYSHSKEMAENAYFSHDSLDGTSFNTRIKGFGYTYMSVGENIAYASGSADANRVFTMWKNSAGHYANMIDSSFNELGLGVYSLNGLTYYTLDLGKRSGVAITPITPPKTITPIVNPPVLNSPTTPVGLFSMVDTTVKQSTSYRFITVKGSLSQKSSVYYYMDNKLHRVCSSCNKFSFYIRTKTDNIQLKLTADDKKGNSEERILNL